MAGKIFKSNEAGTKLKTARANIDPARLRILEITRKMRPYNEAEKTDLEKIAEMVSLHPNIFSRECLAGHVTASALVINPETGMILLHKHKKFDRWLQFGGHADGETDPGAVAYKEAVEETGLNDLKFLVQTASGWSALGHEKSAGLLPTDAELQTIPAMGGVPEHYHLDFMFVLTTAATMIPKPDKQESQELRFYSFEELEKGKLAKDLGPGLKRLLIKAKKILNS